MVLLQHIAYNAHLKRGFLAAFIFLSVHVLTAQNSTNNNDANTTDRALVYKYGGTSGLAAFIRENLRYPQNGECITGTVYVKFNVDGSGVVKDVIVKRGISKSADEEAVRVVKLLEFLPATQNGTPVETELVLPVSFNIQRD